MTKFLRLKICMAWKFCEFQAMYKFELIWAYVQICDTNFGDCTGTSMNNNNKKKRADQCDCDLLWKFGSNSIKATADFPMLITIIHWLVAIKATCENTEAAGSIVVVSRYQQVCSLFDQPRPASQKMTGPHPTFEHVYRDLLSTWSSRPVWLTAWQSEFGAKTKLFHNNLKSLCLNCDLVKIFRLGVG